MTFEAKKIPMIPQKNWVATAYLSSANRNLSRQSKAELGMHGGLNKFLLTKWPNKFQNSLICALNSHN